MAGPGPECRTIRLSVCSVPIFRAVSPVTPDGFTFQATMSTKWHSPAARGFPSMGSPDAETRAVTSSCREPLRSNRSATEAVMKRLRIVSVCIGLLSVVILGSLAVRAAATPDLKPMVAKYWSAWEQGPDAAAPLYAKDAGLVFYDLEPVKYVGWTAYQAGVGPNILAKFDSVTFTVNDDVKTTAHGNIAWTSAT